MPGTEWRQTVDNWPMEAEGKQRGADVQNSGTRRGEREHKSVAPFGPSSSSSLTRKASIKKVPFYPMHPLPKSAT